MKVDVLALRFQDAVMRFPRISYSFEPSMLLPAHRMLLGAFVRPLRDLELTGALTPSEREKLYEFMFSKFINVSATADVVVPSFQFMRRRFSITETKNKSKKKGVSKKYELYDYELGVTEMVNVKGLTVAYVFEHDENILKVLNKVKDHITLYNDYFIAYPVETVVTITSPKESSAINTYTTVDKINLDLLKSKGEEVPITKMLIHSGKKHLYEPKTVILPLTKVYPRTYPLLGYGYYKGTTLSLKSKSDVVEVEISGHKIKVLL